MADKVLINALLWISKISNEHKNSNKMVDIRPTDAKDQEISDMSLDF